MSQAGPAKHSPTRYSTYITAHENYLDQLRASGFVREDSLEITPFESGLFKIQGEISCLGNIAVRVEKTLIVLGEEEDTDPLVQTILYAYNASVRGHENFLRYNNLHTVPGHRDAHHKNFFDWQTGKHLSGSPAWVGEESWPTLGEYLEEVREWFWDHLKELPEPNAYGAIDVRG